MAAAVLFDLPDDQFIRTTDGDMLCGNPQLFRSFPVCIEIQ